MDIGKLARLLAIWFMAGTVSQAQQSLESTDKGIWKSDVGSGFERGVHTLTLEAGVNYGLEAFGSLESHHLALVSLSYGQTFGGVVGQDHWYRGNFEWRMELFGGAQFSPEAEWLIGLTPHLRYNFATGTRWVPFMDIGAGVAATGIGPPDLSNTFEFNLQASAGVHWFLSNKLAVTADVRYFHMSCAGISSPNLGLNGVTGMIGVTRFF